MLLAAHGKPCPGVTLLKARATQGEPGQDSSAQGMYRWGIGGDGLELVEPAPVVPVVKEEQEDSPVLASVSSPTEMPVPTSPSESGFVPVAGEEDARPFIQ